MWYFKVYKYFTNDYHFNTFFLMTQILIFLPSSKEEFKKINVMVMLFASVERFSVSRMRFFLSLEIELLCILLRILNLERHQNCIIGSKFTKITAVFFPAAIYWNGVLCPQVLLWVCVSRLRLQNPLKFCIFRNRGQF